MNIQIYIHLSRENVDVNKKEIDVSYQIRAMYIWIGNQMHRIIKKKMYMNMEKEHKTNGVQHEKHRWTER